MLRIDALIYGGKLAKAADDNPVEHQLGLLRAAFEAQAQRLKRKKPPQSGGSEFVSRR